MPVVVASTRAPSGAYENEVIRPAWLTPDQTAAGCWVQVAPPSLEKDTSAGAVSAVPVQAIATWLGSCSASEAALGCPLNWAAPGWQREVPARDQVPPIGPE